MTHIEPILAQLAGDLPDPPDPAPLRARARRRSRRRRAALAAGAVAVVIAGSATLLGGSGGSDLGTVDAPPAPSTPAPSTPIPSTPEPAPAEPSFEATGAEPAVALEVMNALDEFLALLAAGDHQEAARRWEPVWSGELTEAEGVAQLADHCHDGGCQHVYGMLAARRLASTDSTQPDRYEVLTVSEGLAGPHAQALVAGDAAVPWVVAELPPARESGDVTSWADWLFAPMGEARPERVTVARSTLFERWSPDEGSQFVGGGGRLFDLWEMNGWFGGEGNWARLDRSLTCDYSSGREADGVSVTPISIFEHEGRWITELVELGDTGSSARPAHWWDCEAGAEVDLPGLPHSRIAEETEEVLVSDGEWIVAASSADGRPGSVLRRPDGTTISDDRVVFPVFDGATATVAYVLVEEAGGEGSVASQVVVRSVETGELIDSWTPLGRLDPADQEAPPAKTLPVIHLDYDGRFVVAIHGPADYEPTPDAWDLDRHYLIADTTTASTHVGFTPVAWIWLN